MALEKSRKTRRQQQGVSGKEFMSVRHMNVRDSDIQPQRSELGNHDCEYDSDGAPCNHCGKTASEAIRYFERNINQQPLSTDDHWTTSEVLALISELESNETRADKCDAASLKYWDNGFRSAFVMLRAVMSKRQPPATDDEKYRSSCGCLVTE